MRDQHLIRRQRRCHGLGLDREDHRPRLQAERQHLGLGDGDDTMLRADTLANRGIRLDHQGIGPGEAAAEPAVQQRTAHLAAADQHERPGKCRHQASPSVSSIAAASASVAGLPPQITNWKAG